tara:strand:+ start:384 stop:599 length:216 start_codon:yes stop_codon:yes gene_type:complete
MKFIEPSDDTKKALRIASVSNSQLKFGNVVENITITKESDMVIIEYMGRIGCAMSIEQSKYMAEWLQFDYC